MAEAWDFMQEWTGERNHFLFDKLDGRSLESSAGPSCHKVKELATVARALISLTVIQ